MNQQDPLAQLRDIHVPLPAGWWPPAQGWWLLALLVLAALLAGGWWLYRRHRRNAYRRLARAELESAWIRLQRDGDASRYLLDLSRTLRRAARAGFPAARVNGLQGEAWLNFLDQSCGGTNAFSQGVGRDLITLPYRPPAPDQDLEPLHRLALRWLSEHASHPAEVPRAAV